MTGEHIVDVEHELVDMLISNTTDGGEAYTVCSCSWESRPMPTEDQAYDEWEQHRMMKMVGG